MAVLKNYFSIYSGKSKQASKKRGRKRRVSFPYSSLCDDGSLGDPQPQVPVALAWNPRATGCHSRGTAARGGPILGNLPNVIPDILPEKAVQCPRAISDTSCCSVCFGKLIQPRRTEGGAALALTVISTLSMTESRKTQWPTAGPSASETRT